MSGQRQWEWKARRLREIMARLAKELIDTWEPHEYELDLYQAIDCNALAADAAALAAEYDHLEPTGAEEGYELARTEVERASAAYIAMNAKMDKLGQQVRDLHRPLIRAAVDKAVDGLISAKDVRKVIFACPDCVGRAFGFDYARCKGVKV